MIPALLAVGLLLVVPIAAGLHPALARRWSVVTAAVVPATGALILSPSVIAGALALPWLAVTALMGAHALWSWWRSDRSLEGFAWLIPVAYLVVGAGWLCLDRFGVSVAGVSPPFVLLTAVHFTYAGFVASLLALLVRRRTRGTAPAVSDAMAVAVLSAPPIVAAGFTLAGVLQIAGAVVITAGLLALGWLTVRHVVAGVEDRLAKTLLIVSSIAVVVPMFLAVQWAVGWNYGTPALSIPAMARTHGVVNALGFALCGVVGWRRVQALARSSAARTTA